MPNKNKSWTTEEDEMVKNKIAAGATLFSIAQNLGRSESAVKARAYVLGLTLKTSGISRRRMQKWG